MTTYNTLILLHFVLLLIVVCLFFITLFLGCRAIYNKTRVKPSFSTTKLEGYSSLYKAGFALFFFAFCFAPLNHLTFLSVKKELSNKNTDVFINDVILHDKTQLLKDISSVRKSKNQSRGSRPEKEFDIAFSKNGNKENRLQLDRDSRDQTLYWISTSIGFQLGFMESESFPYTRE